LRSAACRISEATPKLRRCQRSPAFQRRTETGSRTSICLKSRCSGSITGAKSAVSAPQCPARRAPQDTVRAQTNSIPGVSRQEVIRFLPVCCLAQQLSIDDCRKGLPTIYANLLNSIVPIAEPIPLWRVGLCAACHVCRPGGNHYGTRPLKAGDTLPPCQLCRFRSPNMRASCRQF
jgi:hypothetical protein